MVHSRTFKQLESPYENSSSFSFSISLSIRQFVLVQGRLEHGLVMKNEPITRPHHCYFQNYTRLINFTRWKQLVHVHWTSEFLIASGDQQQRLQCMGYRWSVNIRLSLEYSPDGRFMFGIGRSSYQRWWTDFWNGNWFVSATTTVLRLQWHFCRHVQKCVEESDCQRIWFVWTWIQSFILQLPDSHRKKIQSVLFFPGSSMVCSLQYGLPRFQIRTTCMEFPVCSRLKFSARSAITAEYGIS